MTKQYLFSDGINFGFAPTAKDFRKAYPVKGPIRIGLRIVDNSDGEGVEIPDGWIQDPDDRSAIVRIPTMRDLVKSLS